MWFFLVLFAGQFDSAFHAGLTALNNNNLQTAESQLEVASRLEPRDARVWLALAQTYWKLRKLPSAQSAAGKAEALAPDAPILDGLARYYSETANDAKAAELLQAAIRKDPYTENYYFELAQLRLRKQDFAAALDTLDAGRKNFDKSPQLELAAGVAYYGLRRFPEAISAFLSTIRLDPDVEQPYVFLGRMLDQAEDQLPAITSAFAAFAKRAPGNYLSSYLYGKSLAAGHSGQAEALLRRSIELNGQFWESHFALGALLDEQGKFEEAAQEFERSAQLNPGDPIAHYRLARLYDRLGKTDRARAERALHAKLAGDIQ